MASIRLGDLLVKAKVITDSQLSTALGEQQRWGGRLGEILVRLRFVSEEMLVKALSKQLGVPAVNLDAVQGIAPQAKAKIPPELARDLGVLPLQLRDDGRTLVVVMAEPQNPRFLEVLRSTARCRLVTQIAGRQAIARALVRFYDAAPEEADGSFRVVDAQGNTVIKAGEDVARAEASRRGAPPSSAPSAGRPSPSPRAAPPGAGTTGAGGPGNSSDRSPSEALRRLEEAQRKEVAALKGMVELMIEKGVFTREEYLAKVRR